MGVLLGAASGRGAVGDSLGQGDFEDVTPTLNQDLHKAQDPRGQWRAPVALNPKLSSHKLRLS